MNILRRSLLKSQYPRFPPRPRGPLRLNSTSSASSPDTVYIQDPGDYEIILPSEPYFWGVSNIIPRPVPPRIIKPPYVADYLASRAHETSAEFLEHYTGDGRIRLGSEEEVRLRKAAKLARKVLRYAGSLVKCGVTTESIDALVHEYIISHSAYPSPLLYSGYPKACCTSVNNVVAHGIPDDRPLQNGDIVNIDITVYLDGFHGDTSQTFLVGDVDNIGRDLVNITNESLQVGIDVCGPGRPFKGIAKKIHELLKNQDYSVCPQFTGHGIGTVFHRPPWILHDLNEEPGEMLPGHCFTIEPCIVKGTDPNSWVFPDGWTASTISGARSAQAEHMVLITESGAEVLTSEDS